MEKIKAVRKRIGELRMFRSGCIGVAIIMIFMLCDSAGAFQIPTGNDDLVWRWENTFRYNLGYRMTDQSDALLKNANMDDGDRNFDKRIVSNRLDILSEMDLVYKGLYSVRVSAAGWYDNAYENSNLDNNNVATSNHMSAGVPALGLNDWTKFFHRGPNGEILDAFVFGRFDVSGIPINLRVGRAATMWGECLYSATNAIGYAQVPLDAAKAYSVPGSEVKELYRPLFNAYMQAQLLENLSMAAQWMLQWEPNRYPEAGSYYSPSDALLLGGESMISGPLRFLHADDVQPDGRGDWGLMFRYTPAYMSGNGAIGFYYRRTSDRGPQLILNAAARTYYMAYADGIDIYGISYTQRISSVSLGAEVSYRQNMPMNGGTAVSTVRPKEGELLGPRGNTWHGLINAVIPFTPPIWTTIDFSVFTMEAQWSHWDTVKQGWSLFKGNPAYTAMDRVTDHAVTFQMGYTPNWYQIIPGWDLSVPLSYGIGVYGNSCIAAGGSEHQGSYSIGLAMDGWSKYNATLKYSNYFGEYNVGPTGALNQYNGTTFFDRGTLMFTFKFTL